jgi:hypothetical protein
MAGGTGRANVDWYRNGAAAGKMSVEGGPIKALESVIYGPTSPHGGRFYVRFHRSAVKSRLKSLRNGAGPLDVPP